MTENIFSSGLSRLASIQQENGSFLSLSSKDPNFKTSLTLHSTFSSALILSALNKLPPQSKLNLIRKKLVKFLLTQKSTYYSFNYWVRGSDESKKIPYPDDLDDTSCALAALVEYDKGLLSGQAISKTVSLLTSLEKEPGGPYSTWIVEKEDRVWKDVDLAVNANIAYFLALQGAWLDKLNKYLISKIHTGKISSPYYPSIYPIIYFLSRYLSTRSANQKAKQQLIKLIISLKRDHSWDNPLNTALSISALLNLGYSAIKLKRETEYLILHRGLNYKPYSFYTGVNPKRDKLFYAGSEALTIACCLEALALYQSKLTTQRQSSDLRKQLERKIRGQFRQRLKSFDIPMQKKFLESYSRVLRGSQSFYILSLPFMVREALGQRGQAVDEEILFRASYGSVCGWIAYSLYDDLVDEQKSFLNLSLANTALRELIDTFTNVFQDKDFLVFFNQVMDQIEQANFWEISSTRMPIQENRLLFNKTLPNYGNYRTLADRSFGHCLAPMVVLISSGYSLKSQTGEKFLAFFSHYLIARQLNDDAHDWVKDLKKGQLNPISVSLLKKYLRGKTSLSLKEELGFLQERFWVEDILLWCKELDYHLSISKKYLLSIKDFKNSHQFMRMLSELEEIIVLTKQERKKMLGFLGSFKSYKN